MPTTKRIKEMITEIGNEETLCFPIDETIEALEELLTLKRKAGCKDWGKRENGHYGPCGVCEWCKEYLDD